jgi:hypothetical protein
MIDIYTTKFQWISQHLILLMRIQLITPICKEVRLGQKTTLARTARIDESFHNGDIVCSPMRSFHYRRQFDI